MVHLVMGIARPGQADTQRPVSEMEVGMGMGPEIGKLRLLLKRKLRVGAQVSARPGNRFDRGAEDGGQAQQRAFEIELRRLCAQQRSLRLAGSAPPAANASAAPPPPAPEE